MALGAVLVQKLAVGDILLGQRRQDNNGTGCKGDAVEPAQATASETGEPWGGGAEDHDLDCMQLRLTKWSAISMP